MLLEYSTLRDESLASIGHRLTVVSFVFGALAIVFSALLTRRIPDLVAASISILFIPQISKVALLIWLGEYNRSQRAGRWLIQLENRINTHVGSNAVGWESHLADSVTNDGQFHMSYPYAATVALLLCIGLASDMFGVFLVGSYLRQEHFDDWAVTGILALLGAIVIVVEILFIRWFRIKWTAAQRGVT
jgi:hypothetical protein